MVCVNRLKDFQIAKGKFRVSDTSPKAITHLRSITGFTRFWIAKLFDLRTQNLAISLEVLMSFVLDDYPAYFLIPLTICLVASLTKFSLDILRSITLFFFMLIKDEFNMLLLKQ